MQTSPEQDSPLLHQLPPDLPRPVDDGACAHLVGLAMPPVRLPSTAGRLVDLGALGPGRTVLYCYPMTGAPGQPSPDGWDLIPGARGCTPQTCAFRDHYAELRLARALRLPTFTVDGKTPAQARHARRARRHHRARLLSRVPARSECGRSPSVARGAPARVLTRPHPSS